MPAPSSNCLHCGLPFKPSGSTDAFCCSGCEYVYRMIHDDGLERFYELQEGRGQPVGSGVFARREFEWLQAIAEEGASSGASEVRVTAALRGISCIGCVWLIQKVFDKHPGGVACRVDAQSGLIDLAWKPGAFDPVAFAKQLNGFGYELAPAKGTPRSEAKAITWRLALCGAFALNGMLYAIPAYLGMEPTFLFSTHFAWLSAFFATASMAAGGSFFIGKAWHAARRGIIHMDLPIALGTAAAYAISWVGFVTGDESIRYFDFVSTFLFLMLAGRWAHVFAIERNRSRLADVAMEPPEVEVDGIRGSATELKADDVYEVPSGGLAPTRSRLLSGAASFGLDWINGESEAREFPTEGIVPSGAVYYGREKARFRSEEAWGDSMLRKLCEAPPDSNEYDRVAQKWIAGYMAAALTVAFAGGGAWWFFGDLPQALSVFVSALVVSCPCAIGIALPMANELALTRLKRLGVFVRSHTLWNRLGRVRQVVFDKTGTLTRARLSLANPDEALVLDTAERRALSALVDTSRHPVASALRERLLAKNLFDPAEGAETSEEVGMGIEARIGGCVWRLGRMAWATNGEDGEGTALSCDGRLAVLFHFVDRPRPDAIEEMGALRALGLDMFLLTGDRRGKALEIARTVGLAEDRVFAEMMPQGKADWLAERNPEAALMVGDGANDSLAFRTASCCGAPASESSILAGKADFYYLGEGIGGVRRLFETGRRRRSAVRGLLVFAVAYNVVALGLCLANWVSPALAALLMPASSVVSLGLVWAALDPRK